MYEVGWNENFDQRDDVRGLEKVRDLVDERWREVDRWEECLGHCRLGSLFAQYQDPVSQLVQLVEGMKAWSLGEKSRGPGWESDWSGYRRCRVGLMRRACSWIRRELLRIRLCLPIQIQ